MSNNCEVQELVREFRERGLQNLLSNLPVHSYSVQVHRKAEVCSKPGEGRHKFALTWSHEGHKTSPNDYGEPHPEIFRHSRTMAAVCLMQHDTQFQGTPSCGWLSVANPTKGWGCRWTHKASFRTNIKQQKEAGSWPLAGRTPGTSAQCLRQANFTTSRADKCPRTGHW